ncbi:MAG: winged helix-turn-helix domain-containing protein [Myxococcota bacterium]
MLEGLVGNATVEKVLLYLQQFEQGYPSEIARTFDLSTTMVQRQLERLERGGIVVSRLRGRTRLFEWNPSFRFREELRALLRKAVQALPDAERARFLSQRRRPRRAGKPL